MKEIFKKIIVSIITIEAKLIIKRYKPKIIAVTGSVGKTSTKDAIFTVLSKFKTVRKSEKSFNSEIGLPLTILGCANGWSNFFAWVENIFHGLFLIIWKQKYPEYLVLEVGVGKPGDIKNNVLPWLKTDIVVYTCFPDRPVHVEFFKSIEDIIDEKSALIYTLKKDGILVLNHDDEKVYNLHTKAGSRVVSYGLHENATYQAIFPNYSYRKNDSFDLPDGINFKMMYAGNSFPVILHQIIGLHNISTGLAAIAVANEIGCDLLSSIEAISEHRNPPGRLSLIEGIKETVIIDDTYNSSPIATEVALKVLNDVKGLRKIVVLGDMLELGKYTDEEHERIGVITSKIADILITIGLRAKNIAEGAEKAGLSAKKISSYDNVKESIPYLHKNIKKGDVILVKGSQGMRLEKVVSSIMRYPENKTKLLCRQEMEWQNR